MLNLQRYADPADFLGRAGPFLRAAEAENVLMLGICSSSPSGDEAFDESCYLATVDDGDTEPARAAREIGVEAGA